MRIINEHNKSDQIVQVAADQLILDLAEDAGVNIPFSCRAGACSTCMGLILEGSVDQTDQVYLTDKQVCAHFVSAGTNPSHLQLMKLF